MPGPEVLRSWVGEAETLWTGHILQNCSLRVMFRGPPGRPGQPGLQAPLASSSEPFPAALSCVNEAEGGLLVAAG